VLAAFCIFRPAGILPDASCIPSSWNFFSTMMIAPGKKWPLTTMAPYIPNENKNRPKQNDPTN
jgi:hypothetical protein